VALDHLTATERESLSEGRPLLPEEIDALAVKSQIIGAGVTELLAHYIKWFHEIFLPTLKESDPRQIVDANGNVVYQARQSQVRFSLPSLR
jgi:hypothetical protein